MSSVTYGSLLLVQIPKIVFWQFEGQGDQLENAIHYVVICVLGKGLDLMQQGLYFCRMLRTRLEGRAFQIVVLVKVRGTHRLRVANLTSMLSGTPPSRFQIPRSLYPR